MSEITKPETDKPVDAAALPKSVPLNECVHWAIRELRLPREEMLDAIGGMISVPAEFKAAYMAQVRLVPDHFRFVRLDAHGQLAGGKHVQHSDVTGF